jgi:hypothetical protein
MTVHPASPAAVLRALPRGLAAVGKGGGDLFSSPGALVPPPAPAPAFASATQARLALHAPRSQAPQPLGLHKAGAEWAGWTPPMDMVPSLS